MRALTKTLFLFTLLSLYLGPALSQSPEMSEQTSDLALVLGAPTPITIAAGEAVEFPITVYNQGDTPAYSVVIANTIPFGFLLADSAWLQSGNVATTTLPEPLPAGASTNLSVTLQASELTPGDPCPDGESTFWDFAEIAGAGTSPDQPTPDVAVNAQEYTAQGAVVRLLPPVLNGAATIDEYFVDEVHLNGNFSVRTGVNISGAGGGPASMQDNLVQTWVFDRPIADAAIFVNDVDGQDIAVINGYFNNRLIQLTPNDFNYEGVTPCPVFRGNNTFQSTTCSADDNTVQGGINIVVPGFINRLEIIYYDPNPNGGGSFSVNFQELCNSPIVDDCPFTNYAEVVYFEDATGNELIDRDSAEIVGADNDPNEVNDAFEDQADHDDLDFSVVVVGNKPENPVIGVAKRLAGATDNGDGSYDLRFAFTLENFGDVPLQNLVLVDDIVNQFDTVMPTNLTAVDGSLQASSSWDGTLQSNILAPGQSIALGESETVFVEFTVSPGDIQAATNIAFATGTSPTGIPVTDISTDGTDPDPDGDNTPDEMVPTVVTFPPVILPPPEPTNTENPVIGLAKQASGIADNGDGTFTLSYELTVANLGDVELSNLTLVDDIQTQFDGLMPVDFLTIDGSLIGSTAWDGTATSNILEPGQSLPVGASGTVSIQFAVTPAGATSATNSATATGTSPDGTTVTDTSTDGANPDPDGDGNPDEMVPTVITFPPTIPPTIPPTMPPPPPPPPPVASENPVIGLAKQTTSLVDNADGSYQITFELNVGNFGDVPLRDLKIVDDIESQFAGLMPQGYRTLDGSLRGSALWNGTADSNILAPGQSLDVGESGSISIQFDFTPGTATSVTNSATATGTSPDGTLVSDDSTDGANPDPNGDGNPEEMTPTVTPLQPVDPTGEPEPEIPGEPGVEAPVLGLAKALSGSVSLGDGSYLLTYEFTVENFGNIAINNLAVFDDVRSQFAELAPEQYRTAPGSLINNPTWNGSASSSLLAPGQTLAVGQQGNVFASFVVTPPRTMTVDNIATVSGATPGGNSVEDVSTDGINPDPDGNGDPAEMVPTVVGFELPSPPPPPPGSIAGSVFEDTNLDGVTNEDLSMFGLPQVTVSLLVPGPNGPTLVASQQTQEDGSFFFPELPAGDYLVEVTVADIPENLDIQTTPIDFEVELAPAEDRGDLDFGFGAQPLAIELEYFQASLTASGVTIEWATAWERETLGYILHRVHADGSMSRVNQQLILATGGGSSYRVHEPAASGGRYVLEELETDLDSNIQTIVAVAQLPAPPRSEAVLHQASGHILQFTTPNTAASHFVDSVSSNPQVLDVTDPESPIELVGEHLRQNGSNAVYFEADSNADILVQPRVFIEESAEAP